jgi:hypothetical protein
MVLQNTLCSFIFRASSQNYGLVSPGDKRIYCRFQILATSLFLTVKRELPYVQGAVPVVPTEFKDRELVHNFLIALAFAFAFAYVLRKCGKIKQ